MSLSDERGYLSRIQEANMALNNYGLGREISSTFNFQTSMRAPFLAAALMTLSAAACFPQGKVIRGGDRGSATYEAWLRQEVHHQLLEVPWFTVFDNLAYQVNGSEVTLLGQVVNPTLKADAETAVKNIEGVTKVNNNIEVLPVSPNDDAIRRAEYRAIYGDPSLSRYSMGALPGVHIIVKNGHVTLVGVVANEMDKNVAGIRANSVSGVFSVQNDLQVQKGS
jgi:hyperosmotically inducible periplasmic protein